MRSSDLRRGAVRCILALLLAALLFWALDFALYPCTFMRNDVHTIVSAPNTAGMDKRNENLTA